MVRDLEKYHIAFAAWVVIYNTASSMPGALLVHYIEDRCWRMDLYSGIFLWNGGSATVAYKFYLSVNKQEKKKHKKNKIYFNRHS